jgi:hypothetical protein
LLDRIPKDTYLRKHVKDSIIGHSWSDLKEQITVNLENLNRASSIAGIRKALYTTDPWKNIVYALRKKRKGSSRQTDR